MPRTFSLFFGTLFSSWYLWQVIVKAFFLFEVDLLPRAKCNVFTDTVDSNTFYESNVLSLRQSYYCYSVFFDLLLSYWRDKWLELCDKKLNDFFKLRFINLGVGTAYFFRFLVIYFDESVEKIELKSICFLGTGFGFFNILGNLSVLIIPPYLLKLISCIFSLNSPKLFSFPQHSDSLYASKKFICLFLGSSSNISKLLLILW